MGCHIHVFKDTRCVTRVNLTIPPYFTHQILRYATCRWLLTRTASTYNSTISSTWSALHARRICERNHTNTIKTDEDQWRRWMVIMVIDGDYRSLPDFIAYEYIDLWTIDNVSNIRNSQRLCWKLRELFAEIWEIGIEQK